MCVCPCVSVCVRVCVCVCVVEGFLTSFVRWLGFLLFGVWELRGGCRVLASGLLFSDSFPGLGP